MESLSAWGKVYETQGKSESADFPPGCQSFLRAHGTFLRCQIRVQLGLETEIGFQQILRMIPQHQLASAANSAKICSDGLGSAALVSRLSLMAIVGFHFFFFPQFGTYE